VNAPIGDTIGIDLSLFFGDHIACFGHRVAGLRSSRRVLPRL